jgi:hypothetical protein
MKKFIKENWFKLSIIITILIIITGLFFWYGYRPTHIKKVCATYAKEQACGTDGLCDREKYEFRFTKCLNEDGWPATHPIPSKY